MFCHSEESFYDTNSNLYESPDIFYKAMCPHNPNCNEWIKKKIKLVKDQELKFDIAPDILNGQ